MKRLDLIEVGEHAVMGSHTFEAEAIKDFARKYDPQPFHLDDEAARQSLFDGLCASGWHTTAAYMRALVDHYSAEDERLRAAGIPTVPMEASPGFQDLRWLKPVYPGDTVTFSSTVMDKRISRSKPDWGIVTLRIDGDNQNGEPVIVFTTRVFIRAGAG